MANLSGATGRPETDRKAVRSALQLKYFIHDSVDGLRFQLIGVLSQASLADLSGCWTTAKTILGDRKLVVDLRALKGTDEAGKQWLLSLAHEGAQYLPETYFRDGLVPRDNDQPARRVGLWSRIFSVVRGRAIPAESSTRAQ